MTRFAATIAGMTLLLFAAGCGRSAVVGASDRAAPDAGDATPDAGPGAGDAMSDADPGAGEVNACEGSPYTPGEQIIVIDWQCPVSECCGDGSVLAACTPDMGGDYYCFPREAEAWHDCVPWNPEVGCPVMRGAVGERCAYVLGERACAPGAFCARSDADAPDGVCTALAPLCNDEACYRDSDCAGDRSRCYGAAPFDGVAGVCRTPAGAVPACLDDSDCPFWWECEGASFACTDACGCVRPEVPDRRGACVSETGFSTPGLWVRPGDYVFDATERLVPHWVKSDVGTDSNWIACPAWTLDVMDPQAGWYTALEEPCAPDEYGLLTELRPGDMIARRPVELGQLEIAEPTQFRLRGGYYVGCEGQVRAGGCEAGPYERYSPAIYLARPGG